MKPTSYELKYCERCGCLSLRRSHSAETYCDPCGRILTSYSLPGRAIHKLLLRKPKAAPPAGLRRKSEAQATLGLERLP